MYHVKTNAPNIQPYSGYASGAIKYLNTIPEGWQASVEYAGCEIWYGIIGETAIPTAEDLIRGASSVNGVDY